MFGKMKHEVVPEVPEVVTRPMPSPTSVSLEDAEVDELCRVSTAIGYESGAVTEAKLRRFLKREGLGLYHSGEVKKYLDSVFGLERPETESSWVATTWQWCPLRPQDKDKVGPNFVNGRENTTNGRTFLNNSYYWKHPVPLGTLLLVEQIVKEVPEASFFVSDAVANHPSPDPFLMVTAAGCQDLIIDCWDEPSFRGSRAKR